MWLSTALPLLQVLHELLHIHLTNFNNFRLNLHLTVLLDSKSETLLLTRETPNRNELGGSFF